MQFFRGKKKAKLRKEKRKKAQPKPKTNNSSPQYKSTKPSERKKEIPVYQSYQSSSPSLKNIAPLGNNEDEDKLNENDIITKEKRPFTQEDLLKTWETFTNSIEKEMPRIFQMLKANEPVLENDFNIKLSLDNQSQERVLMEKAHTRLMIHLKTSLNNGAIQLHIVLGQSAKKNNMVYTSTDKYNYLADINDKLNTLKQKFGLDFE